MPFISENKLEEALVRAVKSPATAPDFYRLLLESDLLVLGTVEGRDGSEKFSLEPGGQLQLVTGERGGEKFLPVFSSVPRMQEYVKEEAKYLAINGRALLDLTRGAPVILNPSSEYGRELTAEQVEQLLNPVAAPGQFIPTFVSDAFYPMALVNVLTQVFAQHPQVQTAWMIRIGIGEPGADFQPLVGIETSGDMAALVAEIERAAAEGAPGTAFDLQRVDRSRPTGMASALMQAQPFYQRGTSVPGRLLN